MSNLTENQRNANEDTLADDLLFTAAAVAKFIGRDRQFVYNKQRHLGLRHVGATLVARNSNSKNS